MYNLGLFFDKKAKQSSFDLARANTKKLDLVVEDYKKYMIITATKYKIEGKDKEAQDIKDLLDREIEILEDLIVLAISYLYDMESLDEFQIMLLKDSMKEYILEFQDIGIDCKYITGG